MVTREMVKRFDVSTLLLHNHEKGIEKALEELIVLWKLALMNTEQVNIDYTRGGNSNLSL